MMRYPETDKRRERKKIRKKTRKERTYRGVHPSCIIIHVSHGVSSIARRFDQDRCYHGICKTSFRSTEGILLYLGCIWLAFLYCIALHYTWREGGHQRQGSGQIPGLHGGSIFLTGNGQLRST
jgi:hypothetical protein